MASLGRAADGRPDDAWRTDDLTRALAGPYATMMLADAGAEVIKVERPGKGDDSRGWGPPFVGEPGDEQSTYFLSVNRSKKSVVLDFKRVEDLEKLRSLIGRADVLDAMVRPQARERLVAVYDHDVTQHEWCTGYRWDIVLTGNHRTPMEPEGDQA